MKIPDLQKHWRIYLLAITVFAILIRSIPTWIYSAWGTDFGIYYSITIEFLDKKNPLYEYPAVWGSSGYGSFPMLYSIILIAHLITHLPPQELLLRIPPIIGGLSVIPLFLLASKLTGSKKIGLVAAALLAINPVHVFQTSMPYLLTVGHLFMLFSLYFFLTWIKERKYFLLLVLSSIALLLSHHLTNYIFIISVVGISFIGGLFGFISKDKVKNAFLFIIPFTTLTFIYWILRVPGMRYFLTSPFNYAIPWYIVAVAGLILFLLLYLIAMKFTLPFQGNFLLKLERIKISHAFAAFMVISLLIFIILAVVGLRGYYIPFISIIYSLPFMLTIGLMGVGATRIRKYRGFCFMGSWILAITASMLFGLVTWASIEPWRHVEYLMEPLSIVGAIGLYEVFKSDVFKKVYIRKRIKVTLEAPLYRMSHRLSAESPFGVEGPVPIPSARAVRDPVVYEETLPIGKNIQIILVFSVVFIILMSGITAFPFMNEVHHSSAQGVSSVVMSGIDWLAKNGDKNYTVATNHLVGTIIAAYGFSSSFEYNYKLWNSTNWTDCIDELQGLNGTYPPIGYVIITKNMYEVGVFGYNNSANPLEPPVIMGEEGYEKFHHEPFELLFRNATANNEDWVEVYKVNWDYIQEYLNSFQDQEVRVGSVQGIWL